MSDEFGGAVATGVTERGGAGAEIGDCNSCKFKHYFKNLTFLHLKGGQYRRDMVSFLGTNIGWAPGGLGLTDWLQHNQDNVLCSYLLILLQCAVLNDVHPTRGVVPRHLFYPEEVLSPHPRHTYCCATQQQHSPQPQLVHFEDLARALHQL